ncbi:hypothetical protein GCM10020331_015080 [Ectobacillus funiculus]
MATVSRFLFEYNANIIESSQYSTNPEGGTFFFMRVEFECPGLSKKSKKR